MNIVEGEWDFQNIVFGFITMLVMFFAIVGFTSLAWFIITSGAP